jgi:hypothetical protein
MERDSKILKARTRALEEARVDHAFNKAILETCLRDRDSQTDPVKRKSIELECIESEKEYTDSAAILHNEELLYAELKKSYVDRY